MYRTPNVTYVYVDDIKKWLNFIEMVADGHRDRKCPWVFRGQEDAKWGVRSSFDRSLNRIDFCPPEHRMHDIEQKLVDAENGNFRDFRRYVARLPQNRIPQKKTRLGWFALMQHYGVPTRLIDFTRNPFVALYFAVEKGFNDYSIWMIDSFRVGVHNEKCTDRDWNMLMRKNRMIAEKIWCKHSLMYGEQTRDRVLFVELDSDESNERIEAQEGLFMMPTQLSIASSLIFDDSFNIPRRDKLCDFNGMTGADYVTIKFDEFISCWELFSERKCVCFKFSKDTRRMAIQEGLFNRNMTPTSLFPDYGYSFELEQIARTLALERRAKAILTLLPFTY